MSSSRDDVDLRSLQRLERSFFRAPSAHNTQPWLLTYERDRIGLGFDPARHLAAGDPTRRDLLLGLGAFVDAVLITAAHEGVALRFDASLEGERVGDFTAAEEVYASPFTPDDLERRRTSRLPYRPGRLEERALADVRAQLARGERLHELAARDVLPLFVAADHAVYRSRPVVRELRRWLRLSKRHPDYYRDGLTYECLDLSALQARVFALLLRPAPYEAVRATRLYRTFTTAGQSLLDVDGSVLALVCDDRAPEAVLAGGRTLLRVWLELARAGLYAHPLSQVIDDPATERELARLLGLDEQRILSVFRAGRSDEPPASHRLV